jgi:hypothetical protein
VAYSGGLEIPSCLSQNVTLRIKYNLCVNPRSPTLFVKYVMSPHIPNILTPNEHQFFRCGLKLAEQQQGWQR